MLTEALLQELIRLWRLEQAVKEALALADAGRAQDAYDVLRAAMEEKRRPDAKP